MGPQDFIIIAIVITVVCLVALYIYRAKKKGQKCIGCPDSGKCSGKCNGCCNIK